MVASEVSLLLVLGLSLAPGFEGRYAIPLGVALGLEPLESFITACLGVVFLSLLLPTLLPLVDRAIEKLRDMPLVGSFARFYLTYVGRVRARARPYVERYGLLGLTVFVAVPLPATGVWTGAIAAHVLGMPWKKTVLALVLGGLTSNVISLLACTGALLVLPH